MTTVSHDTSSSADAAEVSNTVRGVFILIELVLMVVIGLGNSLVIAAFVRSPQLRTISNYLILHLAIADLSVGLWMPMHIAMFAEPTILEHLKLAVLRYASLMLSLGASLLALVFLTLDRFMAIVRPLHYSGHLSVQRCVGLGVGVWTPPLALGFVLPLVWHSDWSDMPYKSHDLVFVLKGHYIRSITLPFLYSCFLLIFLLYIPIFKAAQQHIRAIAHDNRVSAAHCPPHTISIVRNASHVVDMGQLSMQLSVVRPESVNIERNTLCSHGSTGSLHSLNHKSISRSPQISAQEGEDNRTGCASRTEIFLASSFGGFHLNHNSTTDSYMGNNTRNKQDRTHCMTLTEDSMVSVTSDVEDPDFCDGVSARSNPSNHTSTPSNDVQIPNVKTITEISTIDPTNNKKPYTTRTLSEIKMCKTGGIVFAAFFLSWMPFTVVTSLQVYSGREDDPLLTTLSPYVSFLAILNSALNPVVYAFKLHDFKVQFRRMLGMRVRSGGRVSDLFSLEEGRTMERY